MELPEIVEFARNFAVMVRIQGPDPKGLKMRRHAFHHHNSGKTTISASGMLLTESLCEFRYIKDFVGGVNRSDSGLVVTVASIVEPFLTARHRESRTQELPELIPGTKIDVMVEKTRAGTDESNVGASQWLTAQLLALVDIPSSSSALESLIDAPSGMSEHGTWEVGWSLALLNNGPQNSVDALQMQVGLDTKSPLGNRGMSILSESSNSSGTALSTTRIAFLGVPILTQDVPKTGVATANIRGDFLLAVGSPFGILSPAHFFNSVSVGFVSNCYPPSSGNNSLLMADIRCLPGMEGGPVFGEHGILIGILTRPLKQKAGGAEIQLVIPWEAIAKLWNDLLHKDCKQADSIYSAENSGPAGRVSNHRRYENATKYNITNLEYPATSIKEAMNSICLVSIDDGSWASGVLLNNHGLILTNAHLFEPWRFGKATFKGGRDVAPIVSSVIKEPLRNGGSISQKERDALSKVNFPDKLAGEKHSRLDMGSIYSYRRLRVRLDHVHPWIWCHARVVYISKGPLDVAVLKLESVPDELCPIIPEFACPSSGSKAYVIGHGLFGPRTDLSSSVSSGVVARVVKTQRRIHQTGVNETTARYMPAMIETTASVHPGASGGAVVNCEGHMIGLVTSNAKHGGGKLIPHLNFSIPSAALEPIFKFSKDMQDQSILQALDAPNECFSAIWALMPSLSPRQHLDPLESLLDETNKTRRGSQFAKFISERQGDILPKSIQLLKDRKLSNEGRLSKL
ncbi:hypothetical protein Sjap_000302 [Stephania japonica]|uniref:Glyoxysomal processing protease, glyoxysomal n=1 Tax=Stephania japonica TaxID=461633 RepID=A0AAP0KK60_9MAGN